jgi:UDP-N-acetylmuramoyl-L-alanyl-D-glutamate--2,6-diaminopimelate ligase
MKLNGILSQIKSEFKIIANHDLLGQIDIEDIAIDSRLVKKNSIFFALVGQTKDGAEFIADAIKNGAEVIVASQESKISAKKNVIFIISENPFLLLVEFLKIFYSPLPANIYAITGTNGKTSTAEFTRQILEFLEKKSASIGTLGITCTHDLEGLQNSSLTTPDIVSLYKNLQILKKNGIDDVAIEVSSIGLQQARIAGLEIAVGAFTNFTQDHLDYHKSMDEYFRCKMILFENVLDPQGFAVLNSDIEEFRKIKKICENKNHKILEYGFKASDLKIQSIKQQDLHQEVFFEFHQKNYHFKLEASGEFQAFNALCALGIILSKNDFDQSQIEKLLQKFHLLHPAAGRMQRVATLPNKAQIFIDFAHSPDALKNVLKLARKITQNRVLVLFGCGGNRDAKKRPLMGKISSDLADVVIVSDDNPRHEKPETIRAEIFAGCDKTKTIEIENREMAIKQAITMLESGDILILAGKGHEKYQIIGDKKLPFDEAEIVRNFCHSNS